MSEPKRILVVDDDAANLMTLAALLESEGYEVAEAPSFALAEEQLRKAPFDIVLLDRTLGVHDGATLAPLAKANSATTFVCVVSGNVSGQTLPGVDAEVCKGDALEGLLRLIAAS